MMSILEQFTPDVEIYSIDESFLEFKGFEHIDFNNYGKQIRERIKKWTGIPTCVGIAPTKRYLKLLIKLPESSPNKQMAFML